METTKASPVSNPPSNVATAPIGSGSVPSASAIAGQHKRGPKPKPRDAEGNIIRPASPNKVAGADNNATPAQPAIVDVELVRECVKTFLVTVDSTVRETVKDTAFQVTESAEMADNLANRASLKPHEVDMMSKLSANCCVQYNLAGQHSSAVFLGTFLIGYVARVGFTLRQLKAIAALKAKKPDDSAKHRPQA